MTHTNTHPAQLRERRPADWSPAFEGTTHLKGLKPGVQATVIDRGSFAELFIAMPRDGFTPSTRGREVDAAAAKSRCEEFADSLNLWGAA